MLDCGTVEGGKLVECTDIFEKVDEKIEGWIVHLLTTLLYLLIFSHLRSQSTSFALQASLSLSLCVCVFILGLLPPCTAGQLGGKCTAVRRGRGKCTVTPERQMLYTREEEGCRAGGGEETGLWAIHCW